MQCDHLKGVRTATDLTTRVYSLSANAELVTAIANDLGYENVFVYQLQSQAEPGDVLIAISSSWRSANILNALTWARDYGLRTIAITGFDGGASRTLAEVNIHVECTNCGVVEDLGQAVMHALAQYIRHSRISPDVISASVFLCAWPSTCCRRTGLPVRRALVLDQGDPRDGPAARGRRGTVPAGQPEVAAHAPGVRAGCPLHHLPLVQ